MASDAETSDDQTMSTLEELLCAVAVAGSPNRSEAIVYSRCRTDLLQSTAKDLLPGFVYQCLTIYKFKDFISLYDPDVGLRQAFIRRAIERCRSMMDTGTIVPPAPALPATFSTQTQPLARPATPSVPDKSDPTHWMG